MGMTAAVTTADVVARHAARHPVTATFAGIDGHDARWPDWSLRGLVEQGEESAALSHALRVGGALPDPVLEADRTVAMHALSLERDELASGHFVRGNPSLWAGEVAFGLIGLLNDHDEVRLDERTDALLARLHALDAFLAEAPSTMPAATVPAAMRERALREGAAVQALVARGITAWADGVPLSPMRRAALAEAVAHAQPAVDRFAHWLASLPVNSGRPLSPGPQHFEQVVHEGHAVTESIDRLHHEAMAALADARTTLNAMVGDLVGDGGWGAVQQQLEADAESADDYLDSYAREWARCVEASARVITMPATEFAVHFTPIPGWAREAQPALYYLFYRSPAPWRWPATYRYQVPPIDHLAGDAQRARLAQWNRSQIRLNHVVHHGALGHHRQNHAGARARGPMARLAAVDGACRLALHAGGTMAEGWSCYAVDLYEELGLLTPLERVAEQHTRVRILCRALADIALHQDGASLEAAQAIYETQAMMPPAAARAEAVKNAMFPGMAIMYWLGTRTIHAARREATVRDGAAFDLRRWHDRLLSYGALPLPMVVQLMRDGATP
jgi:uncharacterized protein (DUF885 family)